MTKLPVTPSCLLFDFGGVLVEWDGVQPLVELTQGRLSREDARRFWLNSQWVRRFETGRCDASAFGEGATAELGIDLAPTDFLAAFESWDRGPLPGTFELLDELRPRFTLACLSNNNPIHWRAEKLERLVRSFHRSYASFEIGLMKPDREAYEWVISDLRLDPGSILFFDDNPECITGAEDVGILARLVKSPAMVRKSLVDLGVLK